MGRPRKRHVQTELSLVRDKNGQRRGGFRKNAGRKPNGKRAGSPHKARGFVDARHPQHATLRVSHEVGWLRRMDAYRGLRHALRRVLANPSFRIVHISVQGTHVHVLCEAVDKDALARGLQGFQISAARQLNRIAGRRAARRLGQATGKPRRGCVFVDRYHVEPLSSVRQVRHALAYVLNNWRHHDADREAVGLFEGRIDPFSSGILFDGWRDAIATWPAPLEYEPPEVSRAQTWLLAKGWRRAKPITAFEVPGTRRPRTVRRVSP
jgi:REP element-mobilizing transposase RayT